MKRILPILIVVTLFFGCTETVETEQPIITADSIEPETTADEVIEALQGEENFGYFWYGEDLVATMNFAEIDGIEYTEADLTQIRNDILAQQAIETKVTAQEAANIAGNVLVTDFGGDKDEISQVLQMYVDDIGWIVSGTVEGKAYFWAAVDHITGEIQAVNYFRNETAHLKEIQESPVHEAFVYMMDGDKVVSGYWDREHPSFAELTDQLAEELRNELEGSAILNSASIAEIKYVATDYNDYILEYEVILDNGQIIRTTREWADMVAHTEFDHEGYPLRAYVFRYQDENPT